jgi:hypothetical protein
MLDAVRIVLMFGAWESYSGLSESSHNGVAARPRSVSPDGEGLLMLDLLRDLWGFASERKKFWLVPLIGTLVILSVLIAIAEFSTVAPFIYTLF